MLFRSVEVQAVTRQRGVQRRALQVAQGFEAELGGVKLVLAGVHTFLALGVAGLFVQLAGGLVAQQLDASAQRLLQVLADAKACLWTISSSASSRLAPLPGASLTWCSKAAAAACRVALSLRSRNEAASLCRCVWALPLRCRP